MVGGEGLRVEGGKGVEGVGRGTLARRGGRKVGRVRTISQEGLMG